MTRHTALPLIALMIGVNIHLPAQTPATTPFLPRYTLSLGNQRIFQPLPDEVNTNDKPDMRAMRLEATYRVGGRWLVGASYFTHQDAGGAWYADSSKKIVNGSSLPDPTDPFGLNVSIALMELYNSTPTTHFGDAVFISRRTNGYEVMGGYLLMPADATQWLGMSLRFLTGIRLLHVLEQHDYLFNTTFVGTPAMRKSSRTDDQERSETTGLAWTLRLRMDLHFFRHVTGYTEFNTQVGLGTLTQPGTTGTNATGEMRSLPTRNVAISGAALQVGLSVQF